jgi:hypothetical protein
MLNYNENIFDITFFLCTCIYQQTFLAFVAGVSIAVWGSLRFNLIARLERNTNNCFANSG